MSDPAMLIQVRDGRGFVAALDQSGGSTPRTLEAYGLGPETWSTEAEMLDHVHAMRTRLITSSAFTSDRVIATILFEDTTARPIEGKLTAAFLWEDKGIVPFLKVDLGLEPAEHGVQVMRPMPGLAARLATARDRGVFGTKMRSLVLDDDPVGIQTIVEQQFAVGDEILEASLVPILEPEISIRAPRKAEAEARLKASLLEGLERRRGTQIMIKLTLPEQDDLYRELVEHPSVLRVLALSGGYPLAEANARLARQQGVVASFSRALVEGLVAQQSDEAFDAQLETSIASIVEASRT